MTSRQGRRALRGSGARSAASLVEMSGRAPLNFLFRRFGKKLLRKKRFMSRAVDCRPPWLHHVTHHGPFGIGDEVAAIPPSPFKIGKHPPAPQKTASEGRTALREHATTNPSRPPWRRGGFPVITFVPRYLHAQKRVGAFRPTTRSRPRLGLVVRCGDLALSKKIPFCAFFYVQPKISKSGVIFSLISTVFGHV